LLIMHNSILFITCVLFYYLSSHPIFWHQNNTVRKVLDRELDKMS
jgi:hypothetical protein